MNDEERYSFDLQGFLVRRAVLTAAEVRAVNAEIDAQAYPSPDDTIAGQRFAGFLGSPSAPVATSLMDHSAVIDVVREVNGPNARLDHSYGIYIAPGTRGCGCMVAGLRSTRRSTTRSARDASTAVLSVCSGPWAVVEHPAGGGGFCCIPGSHKANFIRPQTIDYGNPIIHEVALQAGDVVIFTEAITHGTLAWSQHYERRSHSSSTRPETRPTTPGSRLTRTDDASASPPWAGTRARP